MNKYNTEMEGQIDFYKKYLKRINKELTQEDVISDSTDGILNGNLIEFKLNINDVNSVLFQTVKYLSAMRIRGKSIPSNIVLISLNTETTYIFNSNDYLKDIEKVYIGSASKNNIGFQSKSEPIKLDNSKSIDIETLITTLKTDNYTKINIDENCIIGWASRYYKENPTAKKSDFIGDNESEIKVIGEIRRPSYFKDFINEYTSDTNIQFKYLMDKLNDDLSKKDLGAFYTPIQYAEKATELVREAIKRVPKGNDYIILDRCAGTGNLEQLLSVEELSHCIVSTYEYYEYKVLMELIGDKVRHIVPPFETADIFNGGTVLGADALSKEYVDNEIIKQYIDNDKCTIIMLENPPYAETNGITRGKGSQAVWNKSFVVEEMKNYIKNNKTINGRTTNDLANIFIWSAFEYYLRQDADSYILFSPIKYWKSQNIVNKEFLNGYGFNRKHFHTETKAMISCILWSNKDSDISSFDIEALNIENNELKNEGKISIRKVYNTLVTLFPKIDKDDNQRQGLNSALNGMENFKNKSVKSVYSKDNIGYLVANKYGFDNARLDSSLVIFTRYDGHGRSINKENYLKLLPAFSAGKYTDNENNWKIMSQLMKTSDGKEKYLKDVNNGKLDNWLLKNLFWTSLTNQSHMRSINGSDGVYYRNELCLDNSNGETIASEKLKELKTNEEENKILEQWNTIIKQAKMTKNYDSSITYGVYQIEEELNSFEKIIYSKGKSKNIYDYPELNGNLNSLKPMLKEYYLKEIAPKLFEYEFLK
jgi:hypothetical protein